VETKLSKSEIAIVGGVGEGLGLALAKCFAGAGYHAVMLARDQQKLGQFEKSIREEGGLATGIAVDLRDEQRVIDIFSEVESDLGPIAAAMYNAGAMHRKPLLEISGDAFEKVWRLAAFGAFVFGREAVRHMLPRGRGTVIFTGATSSLRGGTNFAAFAAGKSAARAVCQSMAREFGPQGIHCASVIVDGAMDMPAIHKMRPDLKASLPEDGMLDPNAVAQTYLNLHRQHRSAWTHEADVRPYSEKF
jgi:NAD(P)-dependent dehydrogenase (short-subunit alcohol dehydrogenase family)